MKKDHGMRIDDDRGSEGLHGSHYDGIERADGDNLEAEDLVSMLIEMNFSLVSFCRSLNSRTTSAADSVFPPITRL